MKRLALAALCLTGFLPVPTDAAHKPRFVASFLPLYCFVANVAGDTATVDSLISGGLSPHEFQFKPQDIRKIEGADLLVLNGLGLEPWKEKLLRNSSPRMTIEVADTLGAQLIHTADTHDEGHDAKARTANPHVWLDPQLAMACVSNVLAAATRLDPTNGPAYATNAAAYIRRLGVLDVELAEQLKPFKGAAVISYHDGLPYFARRYGLKLVAVVEPSAEVTPSARRLAELRQVVRTERVQVLLVDPQASSRLAYRIGKDFGLPVVSIDTLETGALSGSAYEDAMRRNVEALTRAFRSYAQK